MPDWKEESSELFKKIDKIRKNNPPRKYAKDVWTDTYFDGSFGPMHLVEFWNYPAENIVSKLLDKEYVKSEKIFKIETEKAYKNTHVDCYGKGFGEE